MTKAVYVQLGRGCDKLTRRNEMIESLIKSGKKVVFIGSKPTPTRTRGVTYAGAIVDLDILSPERMNRAEQILNEHLKGETYDYRK